VTGGYTWTTYAERLEAASVPWKVYLEPESSGYHMLQHFKQFKNAPTTYPLYQKAMTYGPIGQFEYDAMNDRLPAVPG
jgi:phospholipase C